LRNQPAGRRGASVVSRTGEHIANGSIEMLLAGDNAGAMGVVESALRGGAEPVSLYVDLSLRCSGASVAGGPTAN
jgi:hypothetical protein